MAGDKTSAFARLNPFHTKEGRICLARAFIDHREWLARRRVAPHPCAGDLVVDPAIGLLHAVAKRDARRPAETLHDQRVVAVAAVDALRGGQVVSALQFDAGNVFDDVHQLVDRDRLVAAEIERLDDVAGHDHLGALEAVVDVHEAARLLAGAPDLDLVTARQLGLDDLAADRRRRFLAATGPRAVRPVDIVVTRAPVSRRRSPRGNAGTSVR